MRKLFGRLVYERTMSEYDKAHSWIRSMRVSIALTEQ